VSNLSDLLPAGAAAKQLTFTDSGSGIATKKPVILNSDGTVTEVGVTAQSASFGSTADYDTDRAYYPSVVHDTASGNNVICYRDAGNNSYGTARVVSVSGSTLTFGTAVVFSSVHCDYISADYDASQNKILIGFRDDTYSRLRAVVGTVSGTSISFGSATLIDGYQGYRMKVAYNAAASASLLVFSYAESGGYSNYPYGCVATISGTSVSFGTKVRIESTGAEMSWNTNVYDVASTKNLVAYRSGSGARASVATISGTSVSFGTHVDWTTDTTDYLAGVYDPTTSKTAIFYRNNSQSYYLYYVVGTVSGTSVSFGSQAAAESSGNDYDISASFDTSVNKHIIGFTLDGGADQYRWLIEGTMSGTTMSFTTKVSADNGNNEQYDAAQCYDPVAQKSLLAITDNTTTTAYMRTYTASGSVANLTAQAFVGVADSAISASAAGSIIVQGGTVTGPTASVTIAESLSSAFLYAQDGAADAVGSKASGTGSDNFLIGYEVNDGVARGALAQAATVTSGNISYGSSATIGGASTAVYYYSITYDSTNDKFVVFWRNQSNYYIYAAVVTLTGNSISYGAESAVYSAANYNGTDSFSSTYDPDTDRVILGVCDNGDGYAYSVVIELGTTTIDTVGTPEKIDSASATAGYAKNIALCYDTTENKVIATYVYTGGGGSYYLRVAAGTTTGGATNSITWGSSSVVYSGDANYAAIAYNATDQRVVIAYKQIADGKGYSSVATVSGTTVTANTPSAFFTDTLGGTLYYMGIAHDAYVNKMVIYARATQGDAFNGAIDTAANTITWGTSLDVSSDAYNPPQVVFNASTNQTILSGAGTTKATAGSFIYTVPGTVTGQPLTTGTKYYVTTTGAFSSSAGDPSVNAGLAISTTSLLLNGDS